jgi:hypothetical protein
MGIHFIVGRLALMDRVFGGASPGSGRRRIDSDSSTLPSNHHHLAAV